jgi:hypothetical protein
MEFLVTEQHKPYALIETEHSGRDIDPSLRNFADRLKPRNVVQVVRNPGRGRSRVKVGGVLLAGASRFLSFVRPGGDAATCRLIVRGVKDCVAGA